MPDETIEASSIDRQRFPFGLFHSFPGVRTSLEAQAVLGGGKVGNSFLHRRGIVAKHMQARAMGDDSDFDLHPFLVVVLIICFRRC